MGVDNLKNEDLFNYYECPRRFLLMKENGFLSSEMDQSIKVRHLEITRGFLDGRPYTDADWDKDKTFEAVLRRENILFPILAGRLCEMNVEMKVGGLYWDGGKYTILLPFLSREISDRHRTTAFLAYMLLKDAGIPTTEEALFLGRVRNARLKFTESAKPNFLAFMERGFENMGTVYPETSKACASCVFWNQCSAIIPEKRNLTLKALSGVTAPTLATAELYGIRTIDDLLSKPLTPEMIEKIKGVEKIKLKAYAFINDLVLIAKGFETPSEWRSGESDLYFDIEADITPYLFGFSFQDVYLPFLIKEETHFEIVARSMLRFLNARAGNVYHFFEYERKVLEQLSQKTQIPLDRIKLWDVYDILKRNMILPIQHYSLKMVAKWLGYEWKVNLEGQKSIRYFRQWKEKNDREVLQAILQYNEDDCRATEVIKRWLSDPAEFGIPVRYLSKEEMHGIIMGTQ